MAWAGSYRFEELGRVQFERLCRALIVGVDESAWHTTPTTSVLVAGDGAIVPGTERQLPGPTVVMTAWSRNPRDTEAVVRTIEITAHEWRHARPRSLLLLTNADATPSPGDVDAEVVDAQALSQLVLSRAELRLRMPSLLGICDASTLVTDDVASRSTADLAAATSLARVFVPTRAYAATLTVLERFGFAVLTGPPEMGKTAIARMLGLAKASDGWEFHECIHPDELWERFARDRAQVFVADDAFGSTEYRPEAAERWAVELDRALRAMDDRHWLVWTSRPAPLKAGLRRIHREHGVERFPQPAEVQVDASDLQIDEKALILFRHARAAQLSDAAVDTVRANGWQIVSHEHLTPERIRRFVAGPALRSTREGLFQVDDHELEGLIAAEIREPTRAMTASLRPLAPEHRALLVALLDVPPGPVAERDLVAVLRRHSAHGCAQQPSVLLDRLSDHFVRVSAAGTVTWVHPSWRDLVIDELAADADAREAFLRASGIDGLLLALSTGGGRAGTRSMPLLLDDRDWDAAGDRLAALAHDLDEPSTTRLLISLGEVFGSQEIADPAELDALTTVALELLSRRWDERHEPIPVGLLGQWLELRIRMFAHPPLPELAPTWVEQLPPANADPASDADLSDMDEWLTLVELLREYAPNELAAFGFPDGQQVQAAAFVERADLQRDELLHRPALVRTLHRIARLIPRLAAHASDVAFRISESAPPAGDPETYVPRPLSPELDALLAVAPAQRSWDERLVVEVLRDL